MGGDDALFVVPHILRVFDIETALAGVTVTVHPSEQFGALACEHGPNDHLEGAAEGLYEAFCGGKLLVQTALWVTKQFFYA